MRSRHKYVDLVRYLQEFHVEQLKAERQDRVTGYGWIAAPHRRALSEVAIDKIYRAAVAATGMMR